MKKNNMDVGNQKGMTLVEIMIAVGLLGGLALAGMSLFKNQNEAQKTVEANYEVTTIVSQMRSVLSSIVNCSATFGGVDYRNGSVTRLRKDVNSVLQDVYLVNAQLPGNIRVNSYRLDNTVPGLASNETILKISFSRGNAAIKDEITKTMKVVYTASGFNIVSCYAFNNNSDSYWVLASNGNDIHYPGGNVGIGINNPNFPLTVATPASGSQIRLTNGTYSGYVTASSAQNGTQISGGTYQTNVGWFAQNTSGVLLTAGAAGLSLGRFAGATVGNDVSGSINANPVFTALSSNGNFGLGTTTPGAVLHLSSARTGWDSGIFLQNTGGRNFSISSRTDGGVGSRLSIADETSNAERMVINPNGYVGIGNFNPNYALDISGTSAGNTSAVSLTSHGGIPQIFSVRNQGTEAAPSALLTSNSFMQLLGGGWDGGAWRRSAAYMSFRASTGWSSGSTPSTIVMATTPGGSTTAAERMVINSAGQVGIGTSTPAYQFHIKGGDFFLGEENGAVSSEGLGPRLMIGGASGINSDFIYFQRNNFATDQSELRLSLGDNALGMNDYFVIGGFDGGTWYPRISMFAAGRVGINTTAPSYELDVRSTSGLGGSVQAGAFFYYSDARMKSDVSEIENPLDKILALRGVNFTWKDSGKKAVGFIAQEVEKVEPRLVSKDKEGFFSVQYANIIAIVVEAIKELFMTDEKLKLENERLHQRLEQLELRMQEMEKRFNTSVSNR